MFCVSDVRTYVDAMSESTATVTFPGGAESTHGEASDPDRHVWSHRQQLTAQRQPHLEIPLSRLERQDSPRPGRQVIAVHRRAKDGAQAHRTLPASAGVQ